MNRRIFLTQSFLTLFAAGCTGLPRKHLPSYHGIHTEIWFLDIGYGDAILIRRGNHAALIDGGYPVVTPIILKFLQDSGIEFLDTTVITHTHPDHIGGVYGVLVSGIPVGKILGIYDPADTANPKGFREYLDSQTPDYRVVRRGDGYDLVPGIPVEALHPKTLVTDMNDSSMVLKTGDSGSGVLFCGDIGLEPQNELVHIYGPKLASPVIKMPHHGGDISEEFLDMVNPEVAVISVGINPYGNPRPETLKALSHRKIKIFRTDTHGTLHFKETPGSGLKCVPRGTI